MRKFGFEFEPLLEFQHLPQLRRTDLRNGSMFRLERPN